MSAVLIKKGTNGRGKERMCDCNVLYFSNISALAFVWAKIRKKKKGGETLETCETLFNYTFVFVTKKVCHLCACLVHF